MNKKKSIAFCAPLMNRDDDLKQTLSENLKVIEAFGGQAVLYINIFSANGSLVEWVENGFGGFIDKGLLKVSLLKPLPHWHFSWAKNSFKGKIQEDYYSSLDGDNFLSHEYVSDLIRLIDSHEKVLFHGFSGKWGDGTSGRVTLPTKHYEKFGYMGRIYPRQYDENGLIARALYGDGNLVYASYRGVNISQKSAAFKQAVNYQSLSNKRVEVELKEEDKPLNPRGDGYVQRDTKLSYFQNFNEAYTFLKCVDDVDAQNYHKKKLFDSLDLISDQDIAGILPTSFKISQNLNKSGALTVYAVIKNDFLFIDNWLKHYRELGVERFVIVDDRSETPINSLKLGDDVSVFEPLVGDFKSCKVYWLMLLMRAYQQEGTWALTVDSDEFLDLTEFSDSLNQYTEKLSVSGMQYSPAILVDMLPGSPFDVNRFEGGEFISQFDHVFIRPAGYDSDYFNHHSVKWGFGRYSEYSYRLDSRWRFFSTFDSLRKIPVFRYRSDVKLNQGYHTITYNTGPAQANKLFSKPELIVPIKHYKFVSYFLNDENDVAAYHDRTKENLAMIRSTNKSEFRKELQLSPFVRKYHPASLREVYHAEVGLYRIIGNDINGLHDSDQTYENLRFILENEPRYDNLDKIYVLNRISNREKLNSYKELLTLHDAHFIEIEFDINELRSISNDKSSMPEGFKVKTDWHRLCHEISIRESKNQYCINNNGARNFALRHGKKRYRWVLPWDGNCFLNESCWRRLIETMHAADEYVKYLITPMDRVEDNSKDVLLEAFPSDAAEEPQICFRNDSSEEFDENRLYGFQPKVELLKRLAVPGMWDDWNNIYPWKPSATKRSLEAGNFEFSSAVYRLASGNIQTSKSSLSRSHVRTKGIIDYIDSFE